MVQSQYSLSWESHKTSICSGFSTLQQNGEFVDMTLAADGHYVKVHQALIAMASPYLKELILSVQCQHPVIFLNNVSYKTLCKLLEYIYTGEVLVHADSFNTFAETAKALHIRGIDNITGYGKVNDENVTQILRSEPRRSRSKIVVPTEIKEQAKLPASAKRVHIKQELLPKLGINSTTLSDGKVYLNDYRNVFDDALELDNDDEDTFLEETNSAMDTSDMENALSKHTIPISTNLQYTVSIRGSLQMILNRYIYNLFSTKSRKSIRRWRCVDYRNNKCAAFVITQGNVVLNRANPHNHPYHDKKILAKIENKTVFSALDEIEAYREKERKIMEGTLDENFVLVNEFNEDIDDKGVRPVENT